MKKTASILGVLAILIVAAPASAQSPLRAWWRFDETSGPAAHDSSGRGNLGTVSGGAARVTGYFGSAWSFDGSTGAVSVPNSPSLEPSSAITVSAWVKATGPEGNYLYMLAKGDWGCWAASYGLYTGPNGGLMFYILQDQGLTATHSPDAGTGVWDGNWHFVAGTYDGAAVRLYVDGKQIGNGTPTTGPISYNLPTGNDLFIGRYDGCPLPFTGAIDEPTVWSRAFSPTEVQIDNALLVGLHRFIGRLAAWPGS